jgi:ribonuclease Z
MTMEAFILGTGGMMPLPNRHLTSMLLRRDGELLLFDCGEGTQISLKRLNLRWKSISVIFISHTHADHVTGLPGILMLSSQVDRSEPLYVIGPPKIKEYIESTLTSLEIYINYEIIIKEIDPAVRQVVYQGDGFSVKSFPLKHSRICVGYSLEEDDRPGAFFPDKALALGLPAGPLWGKLQKGQSVIADNKTIEPHEVMGKTRCGRKVSFVTDTLYTDWIASDVYDSDVLICEGMFTDEFSDSATKKRHLTARQSGIIARNAEVLRMGLIHYSPRYTDRQLNLLLIEAQEEFTNTFLCRDRMLIDIPFRD